MADKVESPAKGKIRVFVYGTLKAGHANHRLLENSQAEFVGYDSVTGNFRMTDMIGFPGIFRPHENENLPKDDMGNTIPGKMKGEVWAIEPEGLMSLDLLEGHPSFYRREKLWSDNGIRVWMYILSPPATHTGYKRGWLDPDRRLDSGIWRPSDSEKLFWNEKAA